MAINRNFGIPSSNAEAITGLSAIERRRRADAAAQEDQYEDEQERLASAGQDYEAGYPPDEEDEQGKLVEAGYATKAATDKLFDPLKASRQQNAASAKGALAKLLQNQQDSPAARAANAANLKSKSAQATLAQKANVGTRGMTASGFGASQVAGQKRLGAKAVSQNMAAYDMDRRKEETNRLQGAIGLTGQVQRNELENEAFLRAQAELNQLDREQAAGVGNIVQAPGVGRVPVGAKIPAGYSQVPGTTFYLNGKEYRVYRRGDDGKTNVAVPVGAEQ
jgi:hypothetical protein